MCLFFRSLVRSPTLSLSLSLLNPLRFAVIFAINSNGFNRENYVSSMRVSVYMRVSAKRVCAKCFECKSEPHMGMLFALKN